MANDNDIDTKKGSLASALQTFNKMLEGPPKPFSPLFVIVCFMLVVEVPLALALFATSGGLQVFIVVAIPIVPLLIFGGFIWVIFQRPLHFQSPTEYATAPTVQEWAEALNATNQQSRAGQQNNARVLVEATESQALVEVIEGSVGALASQVVPPECEEESDDESVVPKSINSENSLLSLSVNPSASLQDLETAYTKFTQIEPQPDNINTMKVIYLASRFRKGDPSALPALRKLAESGNQDREYISIAYSALGHSLLTAGGSPQEVMKAFESSLEHASNDYQKAHAKCGIADSMVRLGLGEDAERLLRDSMASTNESNAQGEYVQWLAGYYETTEREELHALALTKAVELKPNGLGLQFSAARALSKANLPTQSVLQYTTLLRISPLDTGALNNIGVEYGHLELPVSATDSYKQAKDLGYGLASANLASNQLRAGFVEEALAYLDTAMSADDSDSFAAEVKARAETARGKEERSRERIISKARLQRTFLSEYASRRFGFPGLDHSFEGKWTVHEGGMDHEVTIEKSNKKLSASWTRDNKEFEFSLTPEFSTAKTSKITSRDIEKRAWSLGDSVTTEDGWAYITVDGLTIKLMSERYNSLFFLDFHRSPDPHSA